MNWNQITSEDQIEILKELSKEKPVLIFKHSRSCSISASSLSRLERSWNEEKAGDLQPYYLDLLSFRSISQKIASELQVEHESPQAIVLKDGKAVYHDSHFGIAFDDIVESAGL
ncbi:bacillithiol system protein YtxJ [Spirosomataceae bacterium TFI 002]|nr:bacillithiol system protein YtxJ [Spirosomataceae bacterium TFI 002]